jgi:hypothetical protein
MIGSNLGGDIGYSFPSFFCIEMSLSKGEIYKLKCVLPLEEKAL